MVVDVAARVAVVVAIMLASGVLLIVGRGQLSLSVDHHRERVRTIAPELLVLALVLGLSAAVRRAGSEVSWILGVNVSGWIYALEGEFVGHLQAMATPPLTSYFAFVYVYGYTFVLLFPVVAYAMLDDADPLRRTIVAYAANYAIGLVCYVLFIAYGPRNLMPDLVESLLYTTWPGAQDLTRQVNRNTNVFPSLHTSLSVTVALLAYRTRDRYPRWFPVASVLAASVAVSTMYLGIHWAIDVVGGVALAVFSVAVADAYVDGWRPFTVDESHSI